MSPPSSIAWRTLEAETTPVAVRMRPARTRTALDRSAAAANGSAMAALPGVRDDRRELRGDGDAEHDPHQCRRVVRRREDEPDLGDDAEREEQPEPHLAAPDEVGDPEGEQSVQERGDGIRADQRRRERVLIPHDDAGEELRRDEVGDGDEAARREYEPERREQSAIGVLPFRVRAGGALEEDEADR